MIHGTGERVSGICSVSFIPRYIIDTDRPIFVYPADKIFSRTSCWNINLLFRFVQKIQRYPESAGIRQRRAYFGGRLWSNRWRLGTGHCCGSPSRARVSPPRSANRQNDSDQSNNRIGHDSRPDFLDSASCPKQQNAAQPDSQRKEIRRGFRMGLFIDQ